MRRLLRAEELREVDKKETRILIQTHPDVLVIPPDPPQLLIKLGQVRTLVREIYRMPAEAKRAFYIFTSAAFMKEAANSLLKALEEPPPHACIILLAENLGDLLPTIRSRGCIFRLGAIPVDQIEALLAERRADWRPAQRALGGAARTGCGGSGTRVRSRRLSGEPGRRAADPAECGAGAGLLSALSHDGDLSGGRGGSGEDRESAGRDAERCSKICC